MLVAKARSASESGIPPRRAVEKRGAIAAAGGSAVVEAYSCAARTTRRSSCSARSNHKLLIWLSSPGRSADSDSSFDFRGCASTAQPPCTGLWRLQRWATVPQSDLKAEAFCGVRKSYHRLTRQSTLRAARQACIPHARRAVRWSMAMERTLRLGVCAPWLLDPQDNWGKHRGPQSCEKLIVVKSFLCCATIRTGAA
jgi:hypothetical protein